MDAADLRRDARRARLRDAVHVWLADPEALPASIVEAPPCLDRAERARSAALRFASDRRLYVAAHTWLRHVLSRYLPRAPADWRFVTNPHGRPALESGSLPNADPRHALRFSLSHTAGLVAVAVAWEHDVGVDVERLRPALDMEAVAPALFSAVERRWFGALPAGEREAAFLGVWTLKEALLKALGVGIGEGLQHIALLPDWQRPRVVLMEPARQTPAPGGVVLARLDSGHAVAVSALCTLTSGRNIPAVPTPARRVDLFDLRRPAEARRAARLFLPVLGIPRAAWWHVASGEFHDIPCS